MFLAIDVNQFFPQTSLCSAKNPTVELHVLKWYFILDIASREVVSGHLVSPKGHINWVRGFQGVNSKTAGVEEVDIIQGCAQKYTHYFTLRPHTTVIY